MFMQEKIERVPTYIKGLDSEIEGGVPKGFVNLVCGLTGTMKSSISFNIIYNEARLKGKNALYISIEQSFNNFSMHLRSLGIDISKINLALASINSSKLSYVSKPKKGVGTIIFLDIPSVREKVIQTSRYGGLITIISELINKLEKSLKYDHVVLDSLNALYAISEIKKPRKTLFDIFEFLRTKNLTSYLILEVDLDRKSYGQYGVEDYLADSVIFVDVAKYERVVQREISVVKMRATKSNINVFTLSFDKGQFKAVHGGKTPIIEFGE